jgi:hypothetical protein
MPGHCLYSDGLGKCAALFGSQSYGRLFCWPIPLCGNIFIYTPLRHIPEGVPTAELGIKMDELLHKRKFAPPPLHHYRTIAEKTVTFVAVAVPHKKSVENHLVVVQQLCLHCNNTNKF